MLGALLISGRAWLVPSVILLAASLFLLIWGYRNAPASPGLRLICVALKILGLLALLACLLEPLWTSQRARPGANFFAIVADNSQGLRIKDPGASSTRAELLRATLNATKRAWQPKLDEQFQVRRYYFDSRLQAVGDFAEMNFEGNASSLKSALMSIRERYRGQPLAGVLLFTDGIATDLDTASLDLSGLPPIYPVVVGTDDPIRDLTVENVAVSQSAFEDAPVMVQVDVGAIGFANERIVAQLFEVPFVSPSISFTNAAVTGAGTGKSREEKRTTAPAGEKMIAEQTEMAPKAGEHISVRFQVRPEKPGMLYYRVRVAAKENDSGKAEATLANNERVVVVDRARGPYRVLYVGGRPNWEFKFLNRAVAEDDQVQLVGLIRIARREPKFEFRGRAGESSNPLFRGFDRKTEETERYDKPVLVRLNTRDELELRAGFPKTAEELYSYHAVIVDDVESEFFSPDQLLLLQKFVSERGGGFLMLGGQESFAEGKFQRTPVGDMLPVYLDQVPEVTAAAVTTAWKLNLTREGWLQPWARLRNNESEERVRLEATVPFQVLNRVRGVKPGASVIASVADHAKQFPAVVVQRFGDGRTGAVLIGDLWRAGLQDEQMSKDLAKGWRQWVRWLVADVPNRVELRATDTAGDPNQPVVLQVRARDARFQPLDNAAVKVIVRGVTKSGVTNSNALPAPIELNAEPVLSEAGLYRAVYVPRANGAYFAEAVVTNAAGMDAGRSAAGWSTDLAAAEFRTLKPNRAFLAEIAKTTGGEVIEDAKLESFADTLPARKVPIMENWSYPLWNTPWVFLFALVCFIAEWGLRRWKGLA